MRTVPFTALIVLSLCVACKTPKAAPSDSTGTDTTPVAHVSDSTGTDTTPATRIISDSTGTDTTPAAAKKAPVRRKKGG